MLSSSRQKEYTKENEGSMGEDGVEGVWVKWERLQPLKIIIKKKNKNQDSQSKQLSNDDSKEKD